MLILLSALIGQLFVSGYFFNAQDTSPLGQDSSFVSKAIIVSIAAVFLMIPLKVIICIFLTGAEFNENDPREVFEEDERKVATKRLLGYIGISAWMIGCGYAIIMFAMNFSTIALGKWLITFFCSFGYDAVLMFNIKVFFKVLFGLLLMYMVRNPIMLSLAGIIAGKIVDIGLYLLKGAI